MNSTEPDQISEKLPASPQGVNLILRYAAIGVVITGIIILFAYTAGWLTPRTLTPARMVDRFEQVNEKHSGFRRNHTKGVCISGWFDSNGQGVSLSKAIVFQPGRVPVIGRFALAVGQPYAVDSGHTVRSMALLFKLPNGEEWRTGMNNIPVFAVNSAQGFYDLLLAAKPDSATGKPDPTKMNAFLLKHPESAKALQLIRNQPVSSGFADSAYNSLDAFRFINITGMSVPVRWAMVPVQSFQPNITSPAEMADTNYLFDALIANIHSHPLKWHLMITLGQPGDTTGDATLPWPPDREQVDVGTLTINDVESEDTSPARDINFDPLVLPNGIIGSDDPLLSARSAAYSQSFTHREGEQKTPSAVSPAETGK